MYTWDVLKDIVKQAKMLLTTTEPCLNPEFLQEQLKKLPCSENMCISSWSYDMEGHAKKCVERYCELANKTTQQLYKVSTPCIDDHHFKKEELKSVGELSKVCSNCCEMLILGTYWKTRYSMVSEQILHNRLRNGPKPVTNS